MTQYNPFKVTKANNRKETKGRKQYIPLYTTDVKNSWLSGRKMKFHLTRSAFVRRELCYTNLLGKVNTTG